MSSIVFLGLLLVAVWFLFSGGSNGSSSAPEKPRPDGVPKTVWDDREDAWRIADKFDLPFSPDIELAIWWRESLGKNATPDTQEEGVGQITRIAMRDVNEVYDRDYSWPPTSQEAKEISVLYDKLNWERAASKTNTFTEQLSWTIRAHNEGPDPHLPKTIDHKNDVLDFHERITGKSG